jgi:hypothetical protein
MKLGVERFRFWMLVQAFAVALIVMALPSSAFAQSARTWVSGVGDDVNPCSRTAPCKTFAGAVAKTAQDGEVNVLDPGGYGTANITKSITIDGGKALAAINNAGTNGIVINAPGATVSLRGLSIAGGGTGLAGISITAAARVNIEDCVISGHANGIVVNTTGGNVSLSIRNTIVRNNSGDGLSVNSPTPGAFVGGTIVGSSFTNNGTGVRVKTNTRLSVLGSNFSNNTTAGVVAETNAGVSLKNSLIAYNANGVQVLSGGFARLSEMEIIQNATGTNIAGGTAYTTGNNHFAGNTTNLIGGALTNEVPGAM